MNLPDAGANPAGTLPVLTSNLADLANGIVLYLRLPIISQNCTYWTKSIYFKALLNSQFPDAAMVCIN
jgi:hypothetical protein